MPTLIRGNLQDIRRQLYIDNDNHDIDPLDSAFTLVDYHTNQEQIQKDLGRSHFVPTHGQTVDHYITDWVQNPRNDFMQGNMTASLFEMALQLHLLHGKNFINDEREESDRTEYFQQRKTVNLAYYNDQGEACGVSFSYSESDPNLWTVSVIQNTTAAPEDRDISIMGSDEIFTNGTAVSAAESLQQLNNMLGSEKMTQLFAGTLTPEGKANFETLNTLKQNSDKAYHVTSHNPLLKKVQGRFTQLQKELHAQITTEQVKKAHTKDIDKVNIAYTTYREETLPQRKPLEDALNKLHPSSQSFLGRNFFDCTMAALGTLALAGLVLSVIPPISIAIITITAVTAIAIAAIATIATIATAIASIFSNEKSHRQELAQKREAEQALEQFDANVQAQYQKFENTLEELASPERYFEEVAREALTKEIDEYRMDQLRKQQQAMSEKMHQLRSCDAEQDMELSDKPTMRIWSLAYTFIRTVDIPNKRTYIDKKSQIVYNFKQFLMRKPLACCFCCAMEFYIVCIIASLIARLL